MTRKLPALPMKYRRILVPTDFSRHSNETILFASTLLAAGGVIRLIHVVKPANMPMIADPYSAIVVYDPVITRQLMLHAGLQLKALGRSVNGQKVECVHLKSTDPAQALDRQARIFKADLVCMSTHGRSGLSKLFFGSIAQKFLTYYQGAVILYRPSFFGKKA